MDEARTFALGRFQPLSPLFEGGCLSDRIPALSLEVGSVVVLVA